jgi:hypothetical protein
MSQHSDWTRSLALYDWWSRFPQCRVVTVPCAMVFHTDTKSALCIQVFHHTCTYFHKYKKIMSLWLNLHIKQQNSKLYRQLTR